MQPKVRAVTLTAFLEVASFLGLDPYEMLRRARIGPEVLADPENSLPAQAVCTLLEESARECGCPTFGLLMAECRTFASLGPLSLLLEHLGSAREVIEALTEYRRHLNDILIIAVDKSDGENLVRVELKAPFATPQAADLAIGVAYVALRGASRFRWQPLEIRLLRAAPDDRTAYERFFNAPVQFASDINGFICSPDTMQARWTWSNETMAGHARRLLALVQLSPETAPVSESASRIITLLLPSAQATIGRVAAQLQMSPRSLQRSLASEDRQFAGLLNEVRRSLVLQHLTHSTASMTSVAALLGFYTPSSFSRWFVGQFGVSPRTWRAQMALEAAAFVI